MLPKKNTNPMVPAPRSEGQVGSASGARMERTEKPATANPTASAKRGKGADKALTR
jgi:hypothetical protein